MVTKKIQKVKTNSETKIGIKT